MFHVEHQRGGIAMIKLLIGGSPCTFWSIAQTKRRETEPSGLGWELFKNYLIAKEKFKPDLFLYENNKSAATAIKEEIKKRLGVCDIPLLEIESDPKYIEINSALVSAQNRQRFYIHNFGWVKQPEDRHIMLSDILEPGGEGMEKGKSYCLTATYSKGAYLPNSIQRKQRSLIAERVPGFSIKGKSRPVIASYASKSESLNQVKSECFPDDPNKQKFDYIAEPVCGAFSGLYATPTYCCYHNGRKVYEVKDGLIEVKGGRYPVRLKNGFYTIRKLTVKECCRLQTMPDDYCKAVSKSQAYKCLGNGWTAEVIIHILNNALKKVPKDEEIVVLSLYDGIATGRYCLDKMGFKNVKYFAYEIDKFAMQVASDNYPDIIECGDAFQVREDDWLEKSPIGQYLKERDG